MDLKYLKKNAWQKFIYNFVNFFKRLPALLLAFFVAIPKKILSVLKAIGSIFQTVYRAAKEGDWKTRLSFVVMGFGQLTRKQVLRGILYLGFELLFIFYMIFFGWGYLVQIGSLGEVVTQEVWNDSKGIYEYVHGDNSLLILLYASLTVFFVIAFIYMWYYNVKTNFIAQELLEVGKTLPDAKADISACLNDQYHKTLLSIPLLGLFIFTIFPIIFMVLIAFTNYDTDHMPPYMLFEWVGLANFETLLTGGVSSTGARFAYTFREVLIWTILWAFFATFSNYFLGMIVGIMINKMGIKFKKLWRTILVITIAVPQFVSLLLMSQMLKDEGIINYLLREWGLIDSYLPFLTDATWARVTVILVNVWIGIPYTMLICTGLLMNIPADLYESARIDGASPIKAYMRITLPYMLHVTTPYLISQFIGNINNFNVIFLLTGGNPGTLDYEFAGKTDLLITWLYKLTFERQNYKLAAVISILTFIVVAVTSLIVYNRSGSVKNEEEFM